EVHADDARALASALTGYSSGGQFSCVVHDTQASGSARATRTALDQAYEDLDMSAGPRQDVSILVGSDAAGRRLGWSVAAFLVAHARTLHVHEVSFDGKAWHRGHASQDGWSR